MSDNLINPEQRNQLELLVAADIPMSQRRRAQLLLLLDAGTPTKYAAQAVGISPGRARHWRGLFRSKGMEIFPAETLQVASSSIGNHPITAADLTGIFAPELTGQTDQQSIEPELTALEKFMLEASQRKGPGVEPDDPLDEAGRKVLRYHFAQMLLHEEGTRQGEDIEELHDMRVATRRMRAAFEVFNNAFTQKAVKTHLKGLRSTGRSLGMVRDLDVFMEKAQDYLSTLPEDRQTELEPLLHSWAQERAVDRDKMLAYLDSNKYADFKNDFEKFVNRQRAGTRPTNPSEPAAVRARDITPVLIYTRLAAVRAFEPILETATLEQFHALRIEFKKLRYTVEFFREILGEEAKLVINDLKSVQDHLGDLNDAQVAIQLLRDYLSVWDAQQSVLPVAQRQSPEPILAYLTYRYNERQHLMQTFKSTWSHISRPEFQQNLALAVSVL